MSKSRVVQRNHLHDLIDDGDGLAGWDDTEAEAEFEERVERIRYTIRPAVLDLIGRHHAMEMRPDGTSVLQHVLRTARGAARLMQIYMYNTPLQQQRYYIAAAETAAMLHEVMPVSRMCFEQLCLLTDPTIAAAVCALTPDLRLMTSTRQEHLCNAVGVNGELAQSVLLADMGLDLFMHQQLLERHHPGSVEPAKQFVELAYRSFRYFHALSRHADLKYYVQRLRELVCKLEERIARVGTRKTRAVPALPHRQLEIAVT